MDKEQLIHICWSKGRLAYKLYPHQRPLYDKLLSAINNPKCLKYVLNCARRWGKSTILCLIAVEFCLQKPNSQVRFAAPTAKSLKKIIQPIIRMLCEDAPDDFKPHLKSIESVYVFPNGSEIHMAGTDGGNSESLRGTTSHLNIIDEAGFATDLDYVMRSILIPQTLTTNGTTLLASTPPKTPAHEFYNIAKECEIDGNYAIYTIHDNPSITQEIMETYMKESGGKDSTTWKREYECVFCVDEDSVIIPEWREEYVKTIEHNDFYKFYHKYVGMDLGVKDFTAAVFGYYDFTNARLIIEDELTLNGPSLTTLVLKDEIIKKETEIWGKDTQVYLRISDSNNKLLLQDLSNLHQLYFRSTNKDSLEAMINAVRLMVNDGKIIVDPKCKQLIGCLKYAVWDNAKKELARSGTYGHYDHLMALVYLVRNIDKLTNPIPRFNKLTILHTIFHQIII